MKSIIDKIYECAYENRKNLGPGYLENVYKNALCHELRLNGLNFDTEFPINVMYKGCLVGEYRADIVVENRIIIELKAVSSIMPAHEAQLVNYLTALNIEDGILINFGDNYAFRHKTRTYKRK